MAEVHLSRRELMGVLAGAAVSGSAPPLAAQFYVWTQQFQAQRKSLEEGIPEALAATRRAGYGRVELLSSFFQGEARDRTLRGLKEQDLALASVYNGGTMHEPAAAEKAINETVALADIVRPAGAGILTFNANPKPRRERKSDEELGIQARYLTRLGKEMDARGLRLILHHHDPEMADNAREWRHLLQNTPLGLCLDLHWIYRGGQDPLALLQEAGPRTASLHLRNSVNNVWTEALGDGDVDYHKIGSWLKRSGYAGYLVVELAYEKGTAITRPLEEDLRLSRLYAERVFGLPRVGR